MLLYKLFSCSLFYKLCLRMSLTCSDLKPKSVVICVVELFVHVLDHSVLSSPYFIPYS